MTTELQKDIKFSFLHHFVIPILLLLFFIIVRIGYNLIKTNNKYDNNKKKNTNTKIYVEKPKQRKPPAAMNKKFTMLM